MCYIVTETGHWGKHCTPVQHLRQFRKKVFIWETDCGMDLGLKSLQTFWIHCGMGTLGKRIKYITESKVRLLVCRKWCLHLSSLRKIYSLFFTALLLPHAVKLSSDIITVVQWFPCIISASQSASVLCALSAPLPFCLSDWRSCHPPSSYHRLTLVISTNTSWFLISKIISMLFSYITFFPHLAILNRTHMTFLLYLWMHTNSNETFSYFFFQNRSCEKCILCLFWYEIGRPGQAMGMSFSYPSMFWKALWAKTRGKRKTLGFGDPVVYREPQNHFDDRHFCLLNISGYSCQTKSVSQSVSLTFHQQWWTFGWKTHYPFLLAYSIREKSCTTF